MLVLTRKLMEKLFIGDNICVTVVRLEGGQVRLGIEAPREISVVRAELVPERQSGGPRGAVRPAGPTTQSTPHRGHGHGREARTSTHESGLRRRGPSR